MIHRPVEGRPGRRQVVWTQRGGGEGPFRARYEFYCATNVAEPSAPMSDLAAALYAAPQPGEYMQREPAIERDDAAVADLARRLTNDLDRPEDQAEALFRYVDREVRNEPTLTGPGLSAVACLKSGGGDAAAKSRLLVALCRNRGIPARVVTGLSLTRGTKQTAHHWVEAWVREQWLPMSPFSHYYGWVPRTYLVFGFGDVPVVRGRNVRGLDYAFLVERLALENASNDGPWLRRAFLKLSLSSLPPAERQLVEFLLLLPVAALIVCLFRNVIGLNSFGTFAPALLGLAFREMHRMPGILVFTSILLTGWLLRRSLDRYHLLQVPRMAVMLTLVVILLIGAVLVASHQSLPATNYITLFPLVILVGMVERFWTLEAEDGTAASFRTLISTLLIVTTISGVLSLQNGVRFLFRYPEALGLILAGQLLIGRYTGYRLTELYRFREFSRLRKAAPLSDRSEDYQVEAHTVRLDDAHDEPTPHRWAGNPQSAIRNPQSGDVP
jgi:hypothetical protein